MRIIVITGGATAERAVAFAGAGQIGEALRGRGPPVAGLGRVHGVRPPAHRSPPPPARPTFDCFTITGHPSAVVTSSGATGAMNQAGTGTPAARNSRFARSLSIASALASAPLPV